MKDYREDPRIKEYLYWDQLMSHLDNNQDKFFNGEVVYPKQFEIHLPADHKKPCQLGCSYCAGKFFQKDLGEWEVECLTLLDKIAGRIPQHIYGGAYTEPLLNPYFMTFMAKTRQYGNSFGIHTNGVLLKTLDKSTGFLSELNRVSGGDEKSYLQVSLDGGTPYSWGKVKKDRNTEDFWGIIDSLEKAVRVREKAGGGHAIRIGYLIAPETGTEHQLAIIAHLAREIGIDSVRFSIPFAHYNQDFETVRKYKHDVEEPGDNVYEKMLAPLVSKTKEEKPYIFWNYPWFTDIDRFDFTQCVYGYFQITLGADGWFYPCSTVSTPTAKHLRVGKATDDIEEFEKYLKRIQNPKFNPKKRCFAKGLRGNRMALECNSEYSRLVKEEKVVDRRSDDQKQLAEN